MSENDVRFFWLFLFYRPKIQSFFVQVPLKCAIPYHPFARSIFFSSFASFRRYNFWTIKAQFVMKKRCKKGYCPYYWPFFNHFLRLDDNFEANALKGVLIIQKMYPRKRVKWQNSILGLNSYKNGLIFLIF